jgi:hypothetical protein
MTFFKRSIVNPSKKLSFCEIFSTAFAVTLALQELVVVGNMQIHAIISEAV